MDIFLQAADIKECMPGQDDTGCDVDECCIGEMEFFKMSKRDEPVPVSMPELKPMYPFGRRQGNITPTHWTLLVAILGNRLSPYPKSS